MVFKTMLNSLFLSVLDAMLSSLFLSESLSTA